MGISDKQEILEAIKSNKQELLRVIKSDKQEILEVVNDFSNHMDKRIDKLDGRMDKLDGRMDKLGNDFLKLQTRVVTKDYLDNKIANLPNDWVTMIRKEDYKFQMLIEIMQNKRLLDKQEAKKILTMEPFPKLYV